MARLCMLATSQTTKQRAEVFKPLTFQLNMGQLLLSIDKPRDAPVMNNKSIMRDDLPTTENR